MMRRRPDWHRIAYPNARRRGPFRRFLPNAREVRHAIGCALVLVAAWWLWELAGIGPTLFTSPANWTLWKPGQGAAAASPEALAGQASVIDGDTIEIHGERIRILDIDAPESRQNCIAADGMSWRCGQRASIALSDWIGQQTVICEPTKKDRYGRWLARCSVGGTDMAAWLAEQGWALPYRECKCEVIREASARAQAADRGIWAGTFQLPWDWRKAN
jgi:endonuclease YncB( thermonuclease family)